MKDYTIGLFAVVLLVVGGAFGYWLAPSAATPTPSTPQHQAGAANSPTSGSSSSVIQTLSVSSSTLSSFYNSDGNDRVIEAIHLFSPMENTTQTITIATSSVASYNTGTTITTFSFATSSRPSNYKFAQTAYTASNGVATSTAGATNLIWPAGTYLNLIGTLADASTTQAAVANGTATSSVKYGYAAIDYYAQ